MGWLRIARCTMLVNSGLFPTRLRNPKPERMCYFVAPTRILAPRSFAQGDSRVGEVKADHHASSLMHDKRQRFIGDFAMDVSCCCRGSTLPLEIAVGRTREGACS